MCLNPIKPLLFFLFLLCPHTAGTFEQQWKLVNQYTNGTPKPGCFNITGFYLASTLALLSNMRIWLLRLGY